MLAKRTCKNQITIPKAMIAGMEATEYFDVSREGNVLILRPMQMVPDTTVLPEVKKKIAKLGLKEKDIDDAIAWARRS
jgi:hypothetical protein